MIARLLIARRLIARLLIARLLIARRLTVWALTFLGARFWWIRRCRPAPGAAARPELSPGPSLRQA